MPAASARRLALVIWLIVLLGCASSGVGIVPTLPPTVELPTRTPTPTATPIPLIPTDAFWIGVEGRARAILTVTPEGQTHTVSLPLNEGQQASNVVASREANALAYLVWNEDDTQRGIALWPLDGPNAQLVAQPLPGYRITDLLLSDDGGRLAYVQVQEEVALDEADWRVESVDRLGESAAILATREMLGDAFPPSPVAWSAGGRLVLFNLTGLDGAGLGIFAVEPGAETPRRLVPPATVELNDPVIAGPALSPDGTRLAYLSYDADAPGAPSPDLAPTNVVRVVELASGASVTMMPPANHAIFGVRWYPDNIHFLLDVVEFAPEPNQPIRQVWAYASLGQPLPWQFSTLGPQRDYLLDFEPFGAGVAFTVLPESSDWELYVITSFGDDGSLVTLSIAGIAQDGAAPAIIHAP